MCNEVLKRLITELKSAGITDWSVVRGGKHQRLMFTLNGQTLMLVLPLTPSDWRSAANSLACLRRLIRSVAPVAPKEQRQSAPRERRHRPAQQRAVPILTSFVVRPDPFQQLGPLLARMTSGTPAATTET